MTEPPARPLFDPAESDSDRQAIMASADLLTNMLDTTVRIPGTSLYLGLDPLLGLIPGIGDLAANMMGTAMLWLAVRLRVPGLVLMRMSLNLFINSSIGAIPGLGDLFSVWFRSHARNARLLRQAAMEPARSTGGDWWYVVSIIGGTAVLLCLAIVLVLWLSIWLWSALVNRLQAL